MNTVEINKDTFDEEVLENDKPVLVDFWAPWCGYCTKLIPSLEAVAAKYQNKLKIVKVNVDDNQGLTQEYRIMSLPTLVLFKDGVEVDRFVGYLPQTSLVEKLSDLI